jgi:hypothetical protein
VFRVARAVLLIVAVFSVLTALVQTWTVTTGRSLLVFGGADGPAATTDVC